MFTLRKFRDIVPGLLTLGAIRMKDATNKLTLLLTSFTRVLLVANTAWEASNRDVHALQDVVRKAISAVTTATDVECMLPQQSAERRTAMTDTLADLLKRSAFLSWV